MTLLAELSKPTPEQVLLIREELEAILGSPGFQSCAQLSKLLRHLVEHALADPGYEPKEQLLGIELYGKQADWNSQGDTTVRTHASRLRKRLVDYYRGPGYSSKLRIDLVPGSYTPVFTLVDDPLQAAPPVEAVEPSPAVPVAHTPPPPSALYSRRRIFSLSGLAASVATGFAAGWGTKPASPAPRPRTVSLQRLTHERGDLTNAAFSADGENVVYSARWAGDSARIYSLKIGQSYSRPLGLPPANVCDLSPSGELLFTIGDAPTGVLARAESAGGPYHEIADQVADAVWMPDNRTIAAARIQAGQLGIELPLGKRIHSLGASPTRLSLSIHPDGRRIAFADNSRGPVDIYVASIDGKVQRVSTGWRLAGGVRWMPGMNRLVVSGARRGAPALHVLDLDSNGAQQTFYSTPVTWNLYDCSSSGRLLASCVDSRLAVARGRSDDNHEEYFTAVANCRMVGLTPNGQFAVLMDLLGAGRDGNSPILLSSSPSRPPARVAEGYAPQISHDGTRVLCVERSAAGDSLLVVPIPAGLPQRYTLPNKMRCHAAEFSGVTDRFLLQVTDADGSRRTLLYNVQSRQTSKIQGVPYLTLVAPGGKWGVVPEGGELQVASLETGAVRKICSLRPGWAPLSWTGNGEALFVYEPTGFSSGQISRVSLGTGERTTCFTLRPEDQVGVYMGPWAHVTPDGRHYAYTFQRDLSDLYVIDSLL